MLRYRVAEPMQCHTLKTGSHLVNDVYAATTDVPYKMVTAATIEIIISLSSMYRRIVGLSTLQI